MKRAIPNIHSQRGVALFVGLMLLLILTVLGLSSSNVTIMQERMAGNVSETNIAFQQAERTLRATEQRLMAYVMGGVDGLDTAPPTWEDTGLDRHDCTMSGFNWASASWKTDSATGGEYLVVDLSDYVEGTLTYGSACRPVSEVGLNTAGEYYLIVARASSPSGTSESILQSIFFWPI